MQPFFTFGFRRAVGLSLLAISGLLLTASAHAQGLSLYAGSNGTISGSGTVVTTGLGGSYDYSGGAGPATSSYSTVEVDYAGVLALQSGGSAQSLTNYGGTLNVFSGSVGSLFLTPENFGDGTFVSPMTTITGGSIETISASGVYAPELFPPGSYEIFPTDCTIKGGTFGTLTASLYGGYDIYGSDLQLTSGGFVTGFLSDGQAIDAPYTNADGLGFLNLHNSPAAVPEASTTVSLGLLLLLGAGGLALAKRHRRPAV